MDYISSRGAAPTLTFKEALLVGLAEDGGLYVPREWPHFSAETIRSFKGMSYTEVAFHVIKAFVDGEIEDAPLRDMIEEAYATFHHPAVVPSVQTGANNWVLEVFYGPTLAFKDVAMQILTRLMDYVLIEQGRRLTIVGATSGDTGGAALEAFQYCEGIDTFFMFPEGKVSDVQRKQMTTIGATNAHAIAIDGSFDDCQNMVKAMFDDPAFRDGVQLSAVNSINWGRVMAQTVYYFTSAVALGAPDQDIAFIDGRFENNGHLHNAGSATSPTCSARARPISSKRWRRWHRCTTVPVTWLIRIQPLPCASQNRQRQKPFRW